MDPGRETLLEFLIDVNTKDVRIKITYEISDSKISFLDLLLFKDSTHSTLQYSTFQKLLNKYLYIPFESFHPTSNKRAFIKGELMRYARNSSMFTSFVEMRALFWKRLRLRGYPAKFLLPIFREINYSNRLKWFSKPNWLSTQRRVVFKSTFNCSHVRIKTVILKYLPHLSSIVSYKSTNTLAHLSKIFGAHAFNVKSVSPKIKHCTFSTLHRILIISCALCFRGCFCSSYPRWNVICTITISYKISSNTILFKLPDEVCMFRRNR